MRCSCAPVAASNPTERARHLREPVRCVLDELKGLTDQRDFDPRDEALDFTVAANDFQRDLIFPSLLREASSDGIDLCLRFMPSGMPAANLLREGRCHVLVTPAPPQGSDIVQARLLDDPLVCFHDATARDAPSTRKAFLASDFIEVRFSETESSLNVLSAADRSQLNKPRISVPNFGALAIFLRGTSMITVQPSLMGNGSLRGFGSAPLPFAMAPLTMYLVWHRRDNTDPAHRWLRERIMTTAESMMRRRPEPRHVNGG